MPPEDDGPARKRGKQRGAAGKNRRQVEDPDEQIGVEPLACSGCGTGLADAQLLRIYRRQVFEASPPPPPRVVQYDVAERRCGCCGQVNQGQAPRFATGRVQWGPSVSARAVLATIGHHLPYGRAAVLLKTLAGLPVSTGFLVLPVADLADDAVVQVADERGVGRPRPQPADGALVGLVPGCSVW
jgi:transposase